MSLELDPDEVEPRALAEAVSLHGARVLEVGCGDGRLAFRYAGAAASVVAIDPSREDVKVAAEAPPAELRDRLAFMPADARALPFRDATFDIAILAWSL